MRLVNWRSLAIAAAGFGLAACGDDVTVTTPAITFTTNPAAVSCVAGTTTAVGLSVAGGSGTPTVTFTASGTGFTVAQNGNSATITCTTAGAGAVNFTITSGGQTATGSIPVTVTAASQPGSPVTAVVVTPASATVVPGGTVQLTAQVTLATGAAANTSTAVTWTSSDTTVATVSTTGLVTAKANAANRSAVISATSVANTNLQGRSAITVGPASSLVTGLSVSPAAVTLTTGQTQQITSNVTLAAGAPAGTSTGVTFVSSDTSIAKVSSTGLITAGSRAGVATITVASVAAPTVVQTVGVTVAALTPVRLTIQGLQVVNGAGNLVPADPTAVAGRLFATLNLDPGSFTPDSVVATLGTQRIVCQKFTAQLAQALRSALTDGSADFAPIQCAINTAAFDTTTGAAAVQNGAQQFNATVFYRPVGGGAATSQTATITQQVTLNNTSGFFVGVSNTPSATQVANGGPATGQTTGPQGVLWRAGTLNVTVVPVSFTGTPAGNGSQPLTVALTDVVSGQIATKTTTITPGGAPVVVQFSGASAAYTPTPASQGLNGYSSPNAGQANGGTTVVVNGGVGTTTLLTSAGNIVAANPVVFVDNANPPTLTATNILFPASFQVTAGPPQTSFVNGSFVFADSIPLAAAGSAASQTDNNGVDRVTFDFQFTSTPAAASPTFTSATSTASIAPSNVSTAYAIRVRAVDALGNASASSATNASQFGVDIAAPTFTSISQPANLSQNTAAQSVTYNGLTDNASGINAAQALIVTASRLATANNVSTGATILACPLTATQPDSSTSVSTKVCPAVGTTNGVTFTQNGYYTVTSSARDRANNVTGTSTRQFVIDNVAPVLSVIGGPPSLITRGQPTSFTNFTATDNLDLINSYGQLDFGGTSLAYNGPTLGTLFDNVLTTNAAVTFSVPVFTAQIEAGLGNVQALTSFTGRVTDAGNNVSAPQTLAIGAGNIAPTPASATFGSRGVTGAALNVNIGTGIAALSVGGNTNATTGSSASVTFVLAGASGTFVNPATTVELRYLDPALGAYRTLAVLSGPTQADNGTNRTYTYTGTYAPSASQFIGAFPANVQLAAVAFASNGDALVVNAPTTIALVP